MTSGPPCATRFATCTSSRGGSRSSTPRCRGVVLAVLALASYAPIALVLGIGVGPLVAALMHCAVYLVGTTSFGWRPRSRACGCTGSAGSSWARWRASSCSPGSWRCAATARPARSRWPLAFVAAYLLALFLVFQLLLWPLAVAERELPLDACSRRGHRARPAAGASMGLALALLLINALGAAAAVLPLLTITVAYSFVAAARFALPPQLEEGPL